MSRPHTHEPEHSLERLVFFSDAVMAIAITLLVIELHPPHLRWGSPDGDYWRALLPLIPNFLNFVISFLVIGSFWAGHHRAFALAEHWQERIVMPNILFLLAVAAFPFFTAFAADNAGMRVPILLYCGWLLLIALANVRLQHLVTAPPIVDEDAAPAALARVRRRGISVLLGAATATLVSLVVPFAAQATLITIPLWRHLLERRAAARQRNVSVLSSQHT